MSPMNHQGYANGNVSQSVVKPMMDREKMNIIDLNQSQISPLKTNASYY